MKLIRALLDLIPSRGHVPVTRGVLAAGLRQRQVELAAEFKSGGVQTYAARYFVFSWGRMG